MLYNLARPTQFAQVIGQADVTDVLHKQSMKHFWHHSYLLYGPSGTGKTTVARILAMALNCQTMNGTGEPCGVCLSCKAILKQSHWDLIEVDAATNRGIDDVIEVKRRAYLTPMTPGGKKVYIIDEAQQLTAPAWGALLKLLEEPPEHLTIILCTTEVEKVPQTIQSRCMAFEFKSLSEGSILGKLSGIAARLSIKLEQSELQFISTMAGGNMRTAENQLEKLICIKL